jgi:PAS domain S-box-containing protein
MNPLLSPYVLIMVIAAIICGFIAVYVWSSRQKNSEIFPLILLMLGIIEWIVVALLGLLDQNLVHKIFWAKIEYIGVVSVPLAVFGYLLYHSGFNQQLTAKRLVWLALIPALTLILAWTNELHGLVWAKYIPYRENGLVFSYKTYGPGFWVYWAYSYLLLLAATVLAGRLVRVSAKLFRWQVICIGIGILAPWVGNIIYVLQINPFHNLDLTPLAFSITGIMLAIGMFRWRLFDIKPIAHAAVIAGMADGMIILDNRDRIVEVNPATQAILGLSEQAMVGKQMEQVFASHIPLEEQSDWKTEKQINIKLTYKGKNLDYELSASPFYDRRSSLEGTIIFLHDVTDRNSLQERLREAERKLAKDALRQSEAKLSNAVKMAHLGHWEYDVAKDQFTFNDLFYAMLRTTVEQVGDYTMSSTDYARRFVHPDDIALVGIEIRKAIESTDPNFSQQLEHRIIYGDGEIGYIVVQYFVVKDDQGRTVKTVGVNQDITARKRAEQELQFRNLVLSTQQEVSLDGILVVDENARIVSYNHRFVEIWSLPAELIEKRVDEPILQLVTDQLADPESFLQQVQYLYQHRQETSQDELILADGRVIERYSAPMFGEDGRYFGRVWYFRETTERKRAEQKIIAALNEKEILLLELYHRTKNNMQVIISMLSLEAARSRNEELKATFKDVANRIYAMAMVHQKLYQSQDLSQIHLQEYLEELARMLVQNYCLSPQKIDLHFDIEPVEVLIDTATPIGLVITELITNSLKHAFPGQMSGEINLHLARTGQEIELDYQDNGIGVSPDFDFRRQKTYGMKSIFALVEHQMRGKVNFEADHGLACHIFFCDTLYTRRVQP